MLLVMQQNKILGLKTNFDPEQTTVQSKEMQKLEESKEESLSDVCVVLQVSQKNQTKMLKGNTKGSNVAEVVKIQDKVQIESLSVVEDIAMQDTSNWKTSELKKRTESLVKLFTYAIHVQESTKTIPEMDKEQVSIISIVLTDL